MHKKAKEVPKGLSTKMPSFEQIRIQIITYILLIFYE